MADEQQTNPQGKEKKIPLDQPLVCQENAKKIEKSNKAETNPKSNNQPQRNDKRPFIVKIDEDKGWKRTEIIEVIGIFVGVIVLIITLVTFWETKRSVDIAAESLNDVRKKDSISEVKDRAKDSMANERYRESHIKDSIIIALSKNSLNAQIGSIKENKSQFDIENRPYIQCGNFTFMEWGAEKRPIVIYTMINLGRSPAKIINGKFGLFYSPTVPVFPFNQINNLKSSILGNYVVKEYPQILHFFADNVLSGESIENIKKGHLQAYFFGEIIYINELNKKKMIYRFNAVFKNPPEENVKMIFNENKVIE